MAKLFESPLFADDEEDADNDSDESDDEVELVEDVEEHVSDEWSFFLLVAFLSALLIAAPVADEIVFDLVAETVVDGAPPLADVFVFDLASRFVAKEVFLLVSPVFVLISSKNNCLGFWLAEVAGAGAVFAEMLLGCGVTGWFGFVFSLCCCCCCWGGLFDTGFVLPLLLFDFTTFDGFIIFGVAPLVAKLASCFSTRIRLAFVWAADADEGVADGGSDWDAIDVDWLVVEFMLPTAVVDVIVQFAYVMNWLYFFMLDFIFGWRPCIFINNRR